MEEEEMDRDSLGTRMKTFYEESSKTRLLKRTPVAIRVDGKAFHTFTRGMEKPFDGILVRTMQDTMKYLCENIAGCVLGYTQSDEITLILVDYQTLTTSAWFDYEVQKLCSVSASLATFAFNKYFAVESKSARENPVGSHYSSEEKYQETLTEAMNKGALFDSRCFNIPKEEVANLLLWRQQDAIRNSIQMLGQSIFSQKQLEGKSCEEIKQMLIKDKKGDHNDWDRLAIELQRGSCCIRSSDRIKASTGESWYIDHNIPVFKGYDRDYIESRLYLNNNESN